MEFQKQVAKKGYQEANAKFMGLASEPREGQGKNGVWRKVKVRFMIEGKQQENKFDMWTPILTEKSKYKSEQELIQFNTYYIGWYEKEETYNGNEWVSKTIKILSDRQEIKGNVPVTSSTPEQKPDVPTFDMLEIKKFKESYMLSMHQANKEPNINHFVGYFYRSKFKSPLIERLEEVYNTEPEESIPEEVITT